ncbi:aminopeptidase [Treponema sp.]|uniref:aminopeptidase n=1 Tax=Treponema sp. TaxID=166 RepID=UPI0025DFB5E2|nr:aminopeptidase [Treponema sp.]MCR5219024.1 aminopeptidase [Treponema sp.]
MNTELINDYKNFLNTGKTERECCNAIVQLAEKNGYKNISDVKSLKAGDKVYVTKFGKAIALFNIGSDDIEMGMNILGAHIDSPRLDVKQNPVYEKDFVVYMNTHYYGGIKKYQWVTLPLAIHGVVCKKDGSVVNVNIGEKEDDPVFCISDILPHLAQKQMKESASDFIPGESLDLIIGSSQPSSDENSDSHSKAEKDAAKKNILKLLESTYGITEKDFGSAELEIVPAGKARDLGFDRSLILAYGQDDRSCAYTSARALFESNAGKRTNVCICVDKEEIGSVGATGMASHFFENAVAEVVDRLGDYSELKVRRALNNSNMLSSDVNAAFDPMNGDLYDRANASLLGGGIVFNKYTGSRGKSGASDASPEFIAKLRSVLDNNKVKYQMAELGKVDQGGGGTIAYLAAKYGMYVLDAGVSVLSMHAPWEITAAFDIEEAYKAYKAFLTI